MEASRELPNAVLNDEDADDDSDADDFDGGEGLFGEGVEPAPRVEGVVVDEGADAAAVFDEFLDEV